MFGESGINPLRLGIIGATDNHAATGGLVAEDAWQGSVFGIGSLDRAMVRLAWNPGGLTGVWAAENTRDSIFAALKRREVFATSGPRIKLRLDASLAPVDCEAPEAARFPMGSELPQAEEAPWFIVRAEQHRTPLQAVELVSLSLDDHGLGQQVVELWRQDEGEASVCVAWRDPHFYRALPSLWYARVKEMPTPRWFAYHCQREGRCDEFPGADVEIQERAWSSPIWYLP